MRVRAKIYENYKSPYAPPGQRVACLGSFFVDIYPLECRERGKLREFSSDFIQTTTTPTYMCKLLMSNVHYGMCNVDVKTHINTISPFMF